MGHRDVWPNYDEGGHDEKYEMQIWNAQTVAQSLKDVVLTFSDVEFLFETIDYFFDVFSFLIYYFLEFFFIYLFLV